MFSTQAPDRVDPEVDVLQPELVPCHLMIGKRFQGEERGQHALSEKVVCYPL